MLARSAQSDHELDPGSNAELLEDRVQMSFDGAFSYTQFRSDVLIGKSVTDQNYDLPFAIA